MEQEVIDEEQLFFRRFPAEKQDQVRGLVNYAMLMGLTGKDLVSIGGKLDRIAKNREAQQNREIVENIIAKQCRFIGKDQKDYKHQRDPRRWIYTDGNGLGWRFESVDYWGAKVTSLSTNVSKRVIFSRYPFGTSRVQYHMKNVMLAVYHGEIVLNF